MKRDLRSYIIIIIITTRDVYCVIGKELNNNIIYYVTDGEHISFFVNLLLRGRFGPYEKYKSL